MTRKLIIAVAAFCGGFCLAASMFSNSGAVPPWANLLGAICALPAVVVMAVAPHGSLWGEGQ